MLCSDLTFWEMVATFPFPLGALSSVGRASALQAECRRFDPCSAHQIFLNPPVKLIDTPPAKIMRVGRAARPLGKMQFDRGCSSGSGELLKGCEQGSSKPIPRLLTHGLEISRLN